MLTVTRQSLCPAPDPGNVELFPFADFPVPPIEMIRVAGTCFEPIAELVEPVYMIADSRRPIRPGDFVEFVGGCDAEEKRSVVKFFLAYNSGEILVQNNEALFTVPLRRMLRCRRISFVTRSRIVALVMSGLLRVWPTLGDEKMRRLARRVLAHRAKAESRAGKKPSAEGIVVMQPRSILR